ncbi:MAG TPA: universal stress protein [Acidimicrobiales bacterium]
MNISREQQSAAGSTVGPEVDSKTIVIGVDGSDGSDRALDWAIDEARCSDRRLLIVHVVSVVNEMVAAPLVPMGISDPDSYGEAVLSRAGEKCDRLAVSHSEALLDGPPAESLVEVSAGAAMLVVGGHRRGPAGRLGSVSEGCVHRSLGPVVLVKHRPEAR